MSLDDWLTGAPALTPDQRDQLALLLGRALLDGLARHPGTGAAPGAAPGAMLSVAQAAAVLGVSRSTVIRKADAGELPCLVMRRGARQTMRRFPRSAIENLAALGAS